MSSKPKSQEPGSESRWFGDDLDTMDGFGRDNSGRFVISGDELQLTDETRGPGLQHPSVPVTMATASTGNVNVNKQVGLTLLFWHHVFMAYSSSTHSNVCLARLMSGLSAESLTCAYPISVPVIDCSKGHFCPGS